VPACGPRSPSPRRSAALLAAAACDARAPRAADAPRHDPRPRRGPRACPRCARPSPTGTSPRRAPRAPRCASTRAPSSAPRSRTGAPRRERKPWPGGGVGVGVLRCGRRLADVPGDVVVALPRAPIVSFGATTGTGRAGGDRAPAHRPVAALPP
jgi:hypothetical protein